MLKGFFSQWLPEFKLKGIRLLSRSLALLRLLSPSPLCLPCTGAYILLRERKETALPFWVSSFHASAHGDIGGQNLYSEKLFLTDCRKQINLQVNFSAGLPKQPFCWLSLKQGMRMGHHYLFGWKLWIFCVKTKKAERKGLLEPGQSLPESRCLHKDFTWASQHQKGSVYLVLIPACHTFPLLSMLKPVSTVSLFCLTFPGPPKLWSSHPSPRKRIEKYWEVAAL